MVICADVKFHSLWTVREEKLGDTIGLLLGEVYARGGIWKPLALPKTRENVWGERVKKRN